MNSKNKKQDKQDKKQLKKVLKNQAGIVREFKEFISRGSVVDLAVGIIIGSAFTAIVNSVVNNLITPLLGVLIGGIDFSSLQITLPSFFPESEPPVFSYGVFIQAVINFFIIAVCVFLIIKFMNTLKKKLEHEKKSDDSTPDPPKSPEVILLEEIRDLLKKLDEEKKP